MLVSERSKSQERSEGLGACSPLSQWFQAQPSITVRPPFKYRAPGPSRTDPVAQRERSQCLGFNVSFPGKRRSLRCLGRTQSERELPGDECKQAGRSAGGHEQ
ncbi:unnamed protein product [Gadus morhua 'NCC']